MAAPQLLIFAAHWIHIHGYSQLAGLPMNTDASS